MDIAVSDPVATPAAVHHVTIATDPSSRLLEFVTDVLGLRVLSVTEVAADQLGPLFDGELHESVRSTMLGSAPAGLLEIVEVSSLPERQGAREAGLPDGPMAALSFEVRDVDAVVAHAQRAGHQVSEVNEVTFAGRRVGVAAATVAGVRVQLTQVRRNRPLA